MPEKSNLSFDETRLSQQSVLFAVALLSILHFRAGVLRLVAFTSIHKGVSVTLFAVTSRLIQVKLAASAMAYAPCAILKPAAKLVADI